MQLSSDPPLRPVALSFDEEESPPAAITPAAAPTGVPRGARALAFLLDAALLLAMVLALAWTAGRLGGRDIGELVLEMPGVWLGLSAGLALAYSWSYIALGGRTPAMALLGLRLLSAQGGPISPGLALARALLALLSGALGSFGFALALFDGRAQTLHDKLCGCVVVVDGAFAAPLQSRRG